MASAACRVPTASPATASPAKLSDPQQPITFDAAFIERRLREHQAWQTREMQSACLEVVEEVELAIQSAADRVRSDIRRSPLFRIRHRHPISPALLRGKKAGV
jgi:hypothetical protein